MSRYVSSDGIASSSDPAFISMWERITEAAAGEQAEWSARLIAMGVKMEHPDDGWVRPTLPRAERGDGSITPCYPRFMHAPDVGDLVALGAPYDLPYRLVRVTQVEDYGIVQRSRRYHFEDTGVRVPTPPPPTSLWSRIRRALGRAA